MYEQTIQTAMEGVKRDFCRWLIPHDWEQPKNKTDLKIKGDKRNGTMSRQQAFGGLLGKRGRKWK